MWSQIRNKHPVWYFDSTGSIIKDVDNKKVFLYSLVCFDEENQNIIPVSEFLTNEHTQSNVEMYLFLIKNILKFHMKGANMFIWAPIIVTDASWTLIGAIHSVFNNLTVLEYLCWCYDILFDEKSSNKINNRIPTRTVLCASHFLKTIAKKAKAVTNNQTINVKKAFLFAFTLLQNSSSIEEFKTFFLHIIYMFGEPYKSERCIESINFIKSAISTRNLAFVDKITNAEFELNDFNELHNKDDIMLLNNSNAGIQTPETSLKKFSPFTKYFSLWFIDNEIVVNKSTQDLCSNYQANFYYNGKLIEIIVDYLHILPLWSGIILKKWQEMYPNYDILTRVTNNLVENWFGRLKNFILKNKKVMPSELVSLLYQRLLAKYLKSYIQYDMDKNKIEKAVYEKVEIWKKENNIKRIKGVYYSQTFDTFDAGHKEEIDINDVNHVSINQILDYCKLILFLQITSSNFYN